MIWVKKKKKKKKKTNAEALAESYRQIRKDWNGINPVTKVIPDKRRKKPTHTGKIYEDN